MKIPAGLLALLTVSTAVMAVEYKAGWQAVEFYDEVSTCRTAILFPAIKAYSEKRAGKTSEDELRNEVIATLPVLEHPAFAVCYCMVNEVAKAHEYKTYFGTGDFTARMAQLKASLDGPVCSKVFATSMSELEKKETREALLLK